MYKVEGVATSTLSPATRALVAARHLALVTKQSEVLKIAPSTMVTKPRCQRGSNGEVLDTPSCFNQAEAEQLVSRSYAMLNLDYASFSFRVTRRLDEVPYNTLIANIGGTLALFLGASISSLFEWLELLLLSLLAAPLFLAGLGSFFVRNRAGDANDMDADVLLIKSRLLM